MRRIIHVPIIHDEFTEGSYLNLNDIGIELVKHEKDIIQSELDNYWNKVEEKLLEEKISKIYQDGFVSEQHCEDRKINPLKLRSRNVQSINNLISKGSELMNTESEEEIRKFSEYLRQGLDINTIHRDRYIVKNINRTLKIRETAVLFIGIGHFENIKNLFKEYNSIYYEEINIDIPYEYISRLYSNIESKLHNKLRKDIIKGNIRSFF